VYSALAVPLALALLVWVLPDGAPAQHALNSTLKPYLWQAGMTASEVGEVNVFRRFSSDAAEPMRTFYADVLDLAPLPTQASGGGQMIRHPVGTSEVKLFPVAPGDASTAPVTGRIGVALLTFFYADQAALESRFAAHGLPTPEFRRRADDSRAAFVRDPDGEWVELVVVADAAPDTLEHFEIGLGTAELETTRAFYRDLMGLTETGPEHDPLLGVDKYTYRHRDLTLNVWAVNPGSERDAETAGMQYIVWNVEEINDVALARGADIDRPLSDPGTMRTVWLRDPNGVSNYFAQFAGHDNSPPHPAH
jgi:catechol 2,3-dioxygenase-like lactoylglutathione lyase family enzyme